MVSAYCEAIYVVVAIEEPWKCAAAQGCRGRFLINGAFASNNFNRLSRGKPHRDIAATSCNISLFHVAESS